MPIYRTATVHDARELAELRWEFRLAEAGGVAAFSKDEFIPVCAEFFSAGLEQGDWYHWVAEHEGRLVACAGIHTVRKIPHPNHLQDRFGYVTNVYTRPAYRNQGIGGTLMRLLVDWARAEDVEFLVLWPSERSVPFYERCGLDPSDALQMALRGDND